jgi:D-alanyl-lipoteichoic acid acyltransferase DltB (MBOAT superfamily)
LYIPLGGSAEPGYKTYRNLFYTMLLGGLWHGANWTFVVWGWLHGSGLAVERWFRQHGLLGNLFQGRIDWTWPRRIFIFHFVCLSWIFFRADSLHSAMALLRGAANLAWRPAYVVGFEFLALFSLPLFFYDLHLENSGQEYFLQERTPMIRIAAAACAIALITFFSANHANAFIYFQF